MVRLVPVEKGHRIVKIKWDCYYGGPADNLHSRTAVVLLGGGIGVTPLLSIMKDLCHRGTTRVFLLWSVTSLHECNSFVADLCRAKVEFGSRLTVLIWITREKHLQRNEVEQQCLEHMHRDTTGNQLSRLLPAADHNHSAHVVSRKTHALMSFVAVLMGLLGIWTSKIISNTESYQSSVGEVFEYGALLDMFLVLSYLFVFFLVAAGGCVLHSRLKKKSKTNCFELVDVTMDLDPHDMEEVIQDIFERYEPGMRPNVPMELRRIHALLEEDSTITEVCPVEIPVIVCGSSSMSKAAKTQCKIPANDQQLYFSLQECEEWKW